MNKLIIIISCVSIVSCAYLSRHSALDVVERVNACEVDLSNTLEIERVSFRMGEIWSQFSNCNALLIHKNKRRGDLTANVMELFEYKDVVGISGGALGFYISGNLNALGRSYNRYTSPEGWMQWQNKQWEQQGKNKNTRPKERKIDRVERNGMDCWRIETKSYLEKNGTTDEYEQSNLGVYYQCWSEDKAAYPPIDLGAGITYRNGKSLYPDLDIDKDVLDPVFDSLKLKKLSDKQYAKHVNKNIAKHKKFCEGMLDSYEEGKRKGGAYIEHVNSEGFLNNMKKCGHKIQ